MGTITASAERVVGAPADVVYGCLADMSEHPKFLPPAFSKFEVVAGGVGAGTEVTFTFSAAGRSRDYRVVVDEPQPGRVLTESDTTSTLVTTFTVTPDPKGSRVEISTSWKGSGGVGGYFERRFAPKALQGVYEDELRRLDEYVSARAGGAAPA